MLKKIITFSFCLFISLQVFKLLGQSNDFQEVRFSQESLTTQSQTSFPKETKGETMFLPYGQFSYGFGNPQFASHFGEVGVGLWIGTYNEPNDMNGFSEALIFPIKITAGVEANYLWDSPHFIYAPKIGIETLYAIFGARLSGMMYVKHKTRDFRIQPEVGITAFGILGVYVGWCLPISEGERLEEVSDFKVSFYIF